MIKRYARFICLEATFSAPSLNRLGMKHLTRLSSFVVSLSARFVASVSIYLYSRLYLPAPPPPPSSSSLFLFLFLFLRSDPAMLKNRRSTLMAFIAPPPMAGSPQSPRAMDGGYRPNVTRQNPLFEMSPPTGKASTLTSTSTPANGR